MAANLAAANLDGFCAGELWICGTFAYRIVASSSQPIQATLKVLMVRRDLPMLGQTSP
jgi:hypothetical protein